VLCEALIRGGGWSVSAWRGSTSHRPFQSDWQAVRQEGDRDMSIGPAPESIIFKSPSQNS
jgi:hypothetical protein